MMRTHSIALLLICQLVATQLHGQYSPIVEEGKYWIHLNYYISGDDFLPVSGHAITFHGDTTVNSIHYKKVYKHLLKGEHPCMYPPCWEFTYPYQTESTVLISFIREDTLAKQIFNLPVSPYGFCDSTEHLILDYALLISDTVNACIYDFIGAASITETPAGIVDSIGSLVLFGKNRITLFTTGFDNFGQDFAVTRISIVEGIGLEYLGLFPNPLSPMVDLCESGIGQCQLLLSTAVPESGWNMNLFPNPTTGILQISPDDVEIRSARVYSMTGEFITEFLHTHVIDVRNLLTGIYLVDVITGTGERFVKRIVKQN